jgi:hypothetical protein
LEDLVVTVAEVVVSTCIATLHSSVHIKLSYLTIKLQSNIHLLYYSRNNQKDLKLDLDRTLGGQLFRFGYLVVDRFGKEGSSLYSFRKSADFCLEEKSAGAISVYE